VKKNKQCKKATFISPRTTASIITHFKLIIAYRCMKITQQWNLNMRSSNLRNQPIVMRIVLRTYG